MTPTSQCNGQRTYQPEQLAAMLIDAHLEIVVELRFPPEPRQHPQVVIAACKTESG